MMILKRREILVVALILLIGIAGVINWNAEKEPIDSDTAMTASSDLGASSDIIMDDFEDTYTLEDMGEHSMQESDINIGEAQYVSAPVVNDYFVEASMSREISRSKTVEMLTNIIDNPNTDAQGKSDAQAQVLKLASITDKENTCESLIKAKGFEQVVVFINENIANVTVKTEGLSATDTAKIQEIIASQTDIPIKNIKIVEVR